MNDKTKGLSDFNDHLQTFMNETERISKLSDQPIKQMEEYLKLRDIFKAIWIEGFEAGCKKINLLDIDK